MGFLDNIGKVFADAGQATLQKGKDAANIAKYNRMIADEEKEQVRIFEQIGQKYFELHTDDAEEAFSELTDQIKESNEKIAGYRELIKELKGITKCPECGTDVPEGAAFCPECGYKIIREEVQEEKDEPADEKIYCKECGAVLTPGYKFCMTCGTKVEMNPVPECAEEESDCDTVSAEGEVCSEETPAQEP